MSLSGVTMLLRHTLGLAVVLTLGGCTMAGGAPELGGLFGSDGGGSSQTAPRTRPGLAPQPTAQGLGSDELFSIYQTILTTYVDRVDNSALVIGAFKGAHAGAVQSGLLPSDTALLDQAPLQLTGNPERDWAQFDNAYNSFLRKLGPRGAEVGSVGTAAARGMVAALPDPLSDYLDSSALGQRQSPRVANVGLVLAPMHGGPPIIRQVIPGGPAERAGVQVGATLHAIDGAPTDGTDFFAVLQRLSGPDGSPAILTLVAPDGPARDVALQRVRIPARPFSANLRAEIEYVQISSLDQGTSDSLRRALVDSAASGARAWLLDLRGNDGGGLQEAVHVAALFVGQQTIVIEEDRSGRLPTGGPSVALNNQLPLAILVDGATAGPAEILAAALQDYQAATIVGSETGGRLGTTAVLPLSDGSAAEITTTRFLSPSGKRLLGEGVKPNEPIVLDAVALAQGHDHPLERALALLSS